ncbi:hypothetical protein D5S17_01955 [Pseudonocardiaceae bacterium YIM PH 21723]|nr:hypothetical protein D5S17_01955 [Pseudonocardiaceae bacterium YIM PH 21723]
MAGIAVPRQLPPPAAHFTGRADVLATLDEIATGSGDRPPMAVLQGPGGIGKSTAAVHWLNRRATRFPDGQLYVDLRAESGFEPVPSTVVLGRLLRGLGVPGDQVPADLAEATTMYRSVTARKRLAILADDAFSAAQVVGLVPASPDSMVLATSRWRLGRLATYGAGFIELPVLPVTDGADLLAGTVGDGRPGREPAAVAELAGLCGGLPLALSIAGARLVSRPRWSIARMVRELADDRTRLAALDIGAVFDLSYRCLPPATAHAYRRLGEYPGPEISPGLAAAVLRLPGNEATAVLDHLVDAGLLAERGADRYGFHELIRLHARGCAEREEPEAERQAVRRRILGYLARDLH